MRILILLNLHIYVAPGKPVVNVSSIITTATSISLSWSVPEGSVANGYEVKWASDQCLSHDEVMDSTITTGSSTNYTILDLRSGTNLYTVSVTAINSAGKNSSETVNVETGKFISILGSFHGYE